jgi:hypothetical protein
MFYVYKRNFTRPMLPFTKEMISMLIIDNVQIA